MSSSHKLGTKKLSAGSLTVENMPTFPRRFGNSDSCALIGSESCVWGCTAVAA